MLNKNALDTIIKGYVEGFESRKNELFKWKAVKHFQENWNIDALDFASMLKDALSKTDTLLTTRYALPAGMILNFAKFDPEATREMFRNLFDESVDLAKRVKAFMESSEKLRKKYGEEEWKSHFQNVNAISTYLWLRFPNKYYIYKYTVARAVAEKLDPNFKRESKGAVEGLINAYQLYDEIRIEIKEKESVKNLFIGILTEDCYPDPELCTATSDIAFYIGKYMVDSTTENNVRFSASQILDLLKKEHELIPDEHDGSYELMRKTIEVYSTIEDYSVLDYTDLDLIYLTCILTTSDGVEKKKERIIKNQHLNDNQKQILINTIDKVWENARLKKYSNSNTSESNSKATTFFGMFGTGFKSFGRIKIGDAWNKQLQDFIRMLADIRNMSSDDEIFDRAESVLKYPFKGLQAGSVSIMLHCLKPYSFPIINGNENMGDLFGDLGIVLKQKHLSETYIANCRHIKQFRDTYLSFKNYRVFDLVARRIKNQSELYPAIDRYDHAITKEQWIDFLLEDRKKYPKTFIMLNAMLEMGGEASPSQLADVLGNDKTAYISRGSSLGVRVKKKFSIPDYYEINGVKYDFIVPFRGHPVVDDVSTVYSWVLRPELKEALEDILDMEEANVIVEKENKIEFDHNIILYGPPGTGKTYHTAIYAVAICEGLPIKVVEEWEYVDVLDKYNKLKEQERITFTTFHQSYGYEEFIEGIRPVMEQETAGNEIEAESEKVEYQIKPGIFKEFCEKASVITTKEEDVEWNLNDSPVVWKVSLEKTGENETRKECMKNNHIRIGWDEYGEDITKVSDYYSGGRIVLNSFYNKMRKGDIVISCYSSEEIDAIGIVRGDPEWDENYNYYKRVRKVDWIAKGLRENILSINGGKSLTLSTVYQANIAVDDILKIVRKTTYKNPVQLEKKNYVFIIDEINRGNISKILGELITLIEESKRVGAVEEMYAKLPYSGKPFGVPDNVYIIGTMNTADRSIALMDTALRRRFSFIEMMPDSDVIKGIDIKDNGESVNLSRMLKTINDRIECLYDREHTIGHAFFTGFLGKLQPTIANLAEIFQKSVIPLLQEYFYEDYDKIRLVLGDNVKAEEQQFIKKIKNNTSVFRGNVSDVDFAEYRYEINKDAFKDINSYIGIMDSDKEA